MAECLLPPGFEMKAMLAATSLHRESSAGTASAKGEKPAGRRAAGGTCLFGEALCLGLAA